MSDEPALPSLTTAHLNAHSRARYDSVEQLHAHIEGAEGGWVWRFEDDPDETWKLHWNRTRLKRTPPCT